MKNLPTLLLSPCSVGNGNWNGIFYMSLGPDWTGTYAIGEQVGQNGGWTTDAVIVVHLNDDINNNVLESFQVDNGSVKYIYRDKFDKSINCSIAVTTFNRVMSNLDTAGNPIPVGEAQWKTGYGWPCVDDNVNGSYFFGNYEHRFLLSTDGAKFYSPGRYNYWVKDSDLKISNWIKLSIWMQLI